MGKTVLPSKFQEWKGLDRIGEVVHEMKCIFREITKDDFGLDGEIEMVVPREDGDGYRTTGGIIKAQAKSGKSYVKYDSESSFATPVEKSDLSLWHNSNFPTLFIVYHPADDALYWKEVRSYVRTKTDIWSAPHRIEFNKENDRFTKDTYQELLGIADASPPRIARHSRERLHSNLFRMKKLPWVWWSPTAETDYPRVRNAISGFTPPFDIHSGQIVSLSNLTKDECPLRPFITPGQVTVARGIDRWASDPVERLYVKLLNRLLAIHIWRLGLEYTPEFRRNYFPRRNEEDDVFHQEWHSIRTGRFHTREVVKRYEYGRDRFWRHRAAELTFRRMGERTWFLQISPKYFFTVDGREPYESDRVGALTTKVKAREKNLHALNDVLFWADVLSGSGPERKDETSQRADIGFYLDGREVLTIDRQPEQGYAEFSIPLDPATLNEEDDIDEEQLSFLLEEDANDEDEGES